MGVILHRTPRLKTPDLIACWPGIGNIGITAIDSLVAQFGAVEIGEIEPWDFFYPTRVIVNSGILQELIFPSNKFYSITSKNKDLLFFIGEEQPSNGENVYADGYKAYQMANLVLDVAEQFGCQRVYTSGAAVSFTHHELKPRVWAVTSEAFITRKMKSCDNIILMSEIEGKSEKGSINGLNGLLIGLAKKRGFESICLMGEIPDYLSGVPFPYPLASRSVLEIFARLLEIDLDYTPLDKMITQVDDLVAEIYRRLPPDIKEKIELRRYSSQPSSEHITRDDEIWLKEHLDEFFKGSNR